MSSSQRLLVSKGSKFYWKAKRNIDFVLSQFPSLDCVEIALWSIEDDTSLLPVYISLSKALAVISDGDVEMAMRKTKEQCAREKKTIAPDHELLVEVKNDLLVSLIINRASIVSSDDGSTRNFTLPDDLAHLKYNHAPDGIETFNWQKTKRVS